MSEVLRWSRRLSLITVCSAIRGLMLPSFRVLFPLYLLSVGYEVPDFGPIATYASIITAALLPITGYLIDSGYVALTGVLSNVFVMASLLIPLVGDGNYVLVITAYALINLSMFMWQPVRGAVVVREVRTDVFGRVYASFSLVFNVFRVVSPVIAVGIAKYLGYLRAMALIGTLGTASSILFYLATKDLSTGSIPSKGVLRSVKESYLRVIEVLKLRPKLLLFTILDRFGWALWMPMLNAYLKSFCGLSDEGVAFFNSLLAITLLITSYPSGYLTDRLGAGKALIINEVLAATSVATLVFIKSPPLIYIPPIIMGVSISLWISGFNALTTTIGGTKRLGALRTGLDSARTFLSVPAPLIGSLLYTSIATTAPFIASTVLLTLATTSLIKALRSEF